MIAKVLAPPVVGLRASVGLLLLRLVVGTAFMFFGWGKIQHPFTWWQGSSTPAIFQGLAALSEFGGGAALVLGLLVPIASFGIACTMGVAAFTHISKGDPFVGMGPSWNPPAILFSVAVLLLLIGPGTFSLDAALFRRRAADRPPS